MCLPSRGAFILARVRKSQEMSVYVHDQQGQVARRCAPVGLCRAYAAYWLGFLLCLLCTFAVATPAPVMLVGERVSIALQAEVLVDTDHLMIGDILKPDVNARFKPPQRGQRLFGDDPVWYKITVQAGKPGQQTWWLEVTPASVDQVTLYQPLPDGTIAIGHSGKNVPLPQGAIDYRHPVFEVKLAGTAPQVLYLQAQSSFHKVNQLVMWTPEFFQEKAIEAGLGWGVYLGICALLVIASIWFEFAIKDGVYLSFAVYVSSCILLVLANTGLIYQHAISPVIGGLPLSMLFSLLANVMGITFFFKFTGMHAIRPVLSFWYLFFVRVVAILLAIGLLSGYASIARQIMLVCISLIYMPCTIILLWRPVLQGATEVRYAFFTSGLLLSLTIVMNFFVSSGWIMIGSRTEHITMLTMLVFFLVIYYAISKRYKRMWQEKEASRLQMLEMIRHSGRALEAQVEEQTQDLRLAMKEVENALAQERICYEEQKNLIAMISHELRTPLAVIDAAAHNLVRETRADMRPMHADLAAIQDATERLSLLVSDQLDQSGLEVLSHRSHAQHIALLPLFDEVHAALEPTALHHRLVIAPALPQTIYADASLLQLILRAVIEVALRSSVIGTTITMDARETSTCWEVDMHMDAPPGWEGGDVAPESGEPRFDTYGLALARQLVAVHSGEILYHVSSAQQRTFRIALPKHARHNGTHHASL